jgi:hypothetical protein
MFVLAKQSLISVIVLLISMITTIPESAAQERINLEQDKKPPFKERLFYGGSLGLQFGNVTLVDISPMIGYKVYPRIGIGFSPTYKYYAYKNYYSSDNSDLKTNVFGGSIFGRVIIYQNFFAHAEYEYLTFKTKDTQYPSQIINMDFQSVLVGAGYREAVAENAFMYILVLWNLNETLDSPYTNPVIRAGFSIGF